MICLSVIVSRCALESVDLQRQAMKEMVQNITVIGVAAAQNLYSRGQPSVDNRQLSFSVLGSERRIG